jgi:hypothetical protein
MSATLVVEGDIVISRTANRVFDVLADPTTWGDVDPALIEVSPLERLSLGATGTMRHRRGPGITARTSWTITAFVPGRSIDNRLTGLGYELTESVELTPDATGTRMRVVDTVVSTTLFGRVMVAMSRGIMERDLRARFANLKTLIEAGPAGPDGPGT